MSNYTKYIKQKKEKNFWQAIIEVTQVPDMEKNHTDEVSWFSDPFGDLRVYGTRFSMRNGNFSWKFFLKENSEALALQSGYSLLSYLKELYPGLNGTVKAKQINLYKLIITEYAFFEFILPKPPYLKKKIPFIQKIVNLFDEIDNHTVKVYILWQAVNPEVKPIRNNNNDLTWKYDLSYKIKIYIKSKPEIDNDQEKGNQMAKFNGKLKSLRTEVKNLSGVCADIKELETSPEKEILSMTPAFNNVILLDKRIIEMDTGNYFEGEKVIDFNIPLKMPIAKARDVINENLEFSNDSIDKNKDIFIGYLILKGVKTRKAKFLPVDHFVFNMLITGMLGSGKTYFNAHLWNEFRLKRPDIGGLNINYFKPKQEIFYEADIYLDIDSPDFEVPFYFEGVKSNQSLLETAYYLTASQGLGNEAALNLYALMKEIIKNEKKLPKNLNDLFERLLDWLEKDPYSVKYHTDITRMIKIRILEILSDPTMNRILNLTNKVPKWFIAWRNGKKIYLDLSMANRHEQRLLTFAIFQMMIRLTPKVEADKLQSFIQIDEAFKILSLPRTTNPNNYDYIALEHLEDVFEEIMKSFRSKGIALIISDSMPTRLFEFIVSLTSIKVIFRTEFPNYNLFTSNLSEQDFLVLQKNRRAIVKNGINTEKYAIFTPDFFFSRRKQTQSKDFEQICSRCKSKFDKLSQYCNVCGMKLEILE